MVDGIVDNITQRNRRRAELILHLSVRTPVRQVQELIGGIEDLMQISEIQERTVYLQDIKPEAYLVFIEYFTDHTTVDSFNQLKQEVNLKILQLLEDKGVALAGKDRLITQFSDQS